MLLGSSTSATDHGPQIPKLSQINSDNLQLSLTVEGFTRDEVYVANITTQNDNGEEIVVGTAKFSEYQFYTRIKTSDHIFTNNYTLLNDTSQYHSL